MIFILIYLILIFYFSILYLLLKRRIINKKIFCICVVITLSFISGFRDSSVGIDTAQFVRTYQKIGLSDWSFQNIRYNIGYNIFVKILYLINDNPQLLLLVSSFIMNYCYVKFFLKYSKNIYISLLLFFFLNVYFNNMNVMRQVLSMSMMLVFYDNLVEHKYFKSLVFAVLSVGFHNVGILTFIIPIIRKIKISKSLIYVFISIGMILFIFSNEFFQILTFFFDEYSLYADSIFGKSNYFGALINFLFYFSIFIAVIVIKNQWSKLKWFSYKKNIDAIESDFMILSIIFLIFSLLVVKMNIFNRFMFFFIPFFIIYISNQLDSMHKNNILKYTIIGLSFTYFIIISIYTPEWYGAIPYHFCF